MFRLPFLALLVELASSSPLSRQACDCWQTKEDGLLFTDYNIFDFSSLAQYVYAEPNVLDDYEANRVAPVTSEYFESTDWTSFFKLQTWDFPDKPIRMINSQNNVYLQKDAEASTYLTLRTHRSQDFQSAAEFDTNDQTFTAASMRIRAKVQGDAGACAGFFVYKQGDDGTQHESDIEILTYNPTTTVHYTTHPEQETHQEEGRYTIEATLPFSVQWTNWQDYRMDWTQAQTTYYVDGAENGRLAHLESQVPSNLIFNMWSWGNEEWEKTMAVGGTAYLNLKQIELAYNTSSGGSASCTNICTLN
ncbi:concanavalin A-like lectin/glucanase domain-containing protein [Truncatella angustata]|uniref:Concanavalin A-like lectin/glucanase domain-containing protein n=1 Tax=Truncatella angustata TaxID=152316 RepID=A0A9P8UL96_9PEZI|nr:concanavalin A-like lectin/glucanase domain-containing protein [Truncatella angustata]KAH6654151.1 concanavalin A-like lectin/glucanase domain-containing protein [Truncatella angustata]